MVKVTSMYYEQADLTSIKLTLAISHSVINEECPQSIDVFCERYSWYYVHRLQLLEE